MKLKAQNNPERMITITFKAERGVIKHVDKRGLKYYIVAAFNSMLLLVF